MSFSSFPLYKQSSWSTNGESTTPYLEITVAFTTLIFAIEIYLDFRQYHRFYHNNGIPKELKSYITEETFNKSIAYKRDSFSLKIAENIFTFISGISFIVLGYLPYFWDVSSTISSKLGLLYTDVDNSLFNEFLITWLFVIMLTLSDTIFSLPFSLYNTFVIEQRHGFNKSTIALFLQDKLMSLALIIGITAPILPILIYIVKSGGPHFYFYVWLFLCIVSIILLSVYPNYIAPLFNKYTKLEDGEVKSAIEDLAKTVEFPLTQLYTVDGSRRSAHSNAYFYGFFKNKRIVLYDTLLKQVELPELLAILGHEIGHWKLWHTIQGFVITQLYMFCLFLAFSFVQSTPALFTSFGFAYSEPMPVFVGLMLFSQTFWGPIDKILTVILTFNSRVNEFAADAFAVSLGRGEALAKGLIKISIENLDNLVPDRWYSSYHYSHPPLVERLQAVESLVAKKK